MTPHYLAKSEKKLRRGRRRVSKLRRAARGSRFLDVGCNVGSTVRAAVESGFQATGIDLDADAVGIAAQQVPAAIFRAVTVEELASEGHRFDVIYSAEVLEHVHDPKSFVAALGALAAPGALIYLTTPDVGHWRVPKHLADWNEVDPPFHIYYFTRQALRLLFAAHGFDDIRFRFNLKPGIRLTARYPD